VNEPLRILLEGRPGSGKTTLLRKLAARLQNESIGAIGFTTRELRKTGRRVGFLIESLQGNSATLASVDLEGSIRVGKYAVDLDALERIALPALRPPTDDTVVIVDELGKMELASAILTDCVQALFDGPNDIVATVHAFRHPVTDRLKQRTDVKILRVTHANRDELPDHLFSMLASRRSERSAP
jgi:nucleoside-triphosphatase